MTFEEWWANREYPYTDKDCAGEAYEAGYNEGLLYSLEEIRELQEFINLGMSADARMVADAHAFMKEFDICPECRSVYGKHKMDCGRQR